MVNVGRPFAFIRTGCGIFPHQSGAPSGKHYMIAFSLQMFKLCALTLVRTAEAEGVILFA